MIGGLLLATPDPPGGGERRILGHPDELEGEVPVGPRAGANVVGDDPLGGGHTVPGAFRALRWLACERLNPVAPIAIADKSAIQ